MSGPQRRLGSTDWIDHCAALAPVRRIALLGASADANAAAAAALESTPVHAPDCLSLPADPWQPERLPEIAAQISAFAPDVLLIGMGMPLQERVAAQLAQLTDVPVIAAVGGAIDQISGAQPLAPRWLGRLGLEWLFRLLSDPRRLAHRYLVEPVLLRKTLVARKARP
ncbi:WecB/TagA/CpsF family glycosyltransferase [Nesterenkonia sp.]|uniref:WecB/TagA/CpsF family glycosyltransferase n=1 Tax=Nesterenkonia sp. TaxID=704201 RepID=UPI00345155D1